MRRAAHTRASGLQRSKISGPFPGPGGPDYSLPTPVRRKVAGLRPVEDNWAEAARRSNSGGSAIIFMDFSRDFPSLRRQCGSGGTGRHTILRGWRRKACGFKSRLPHHDSSEISGNKKGPAAGSRASKMIYVLTVIHVIVCVFLIVVVLLQSGKSADIAAAFGGMGSQTAFGPRGAATLLSKATTASAVIFMVTSISLTILAFRAPKGSSGSVLGGTKTTAPAKPATVPPKPEPQPVTPK